MKIRWYATGDLSFETEGCPPLKGEMIYLRNSKYLDKKGEGKRDSREVKKFIVESVTRSLACCPVSLEVIRPKLTSSGDQRYAEAMQIAESHFEGGKENGFSGDRNHIIVVTDCAEVTLSEIITDPL